MATKKISELSAAGTLAGTELVPIVQAGATVRSTLSAIAGLAANLTYSTLNFASGGVLSFNSGADTLTHSAGALTWSGNLLTSASVGTVTTGATTAAEEHGDGRDHVTKLTMTAFAIGTSGDAVDLGIGAKFYTFPAGTILIKSATLVGGITATISITTDTPEVGIGTVVASGVVAVLSGTATFEDIIDGNASGSGGDTVAPDVAGTTFYKSSAFTAPVLIKTSGGKSHDLFLNVADNWANVTAAGPVTFTGTITLEWSLAS